MNVEEYSLKFTLLSKYSLSLVSNSRDEISRFLTSVSYLVKEESHVTMLRNDMILSRIIVYS